MNYQVIESKKTQIIEFHRLIHRSMRDALDYALQAGQLLTEVKDELKHGDFLPWVKANMPFAERTAQRYMKLHEYRDKCDRVADLQEAYKQIETIEAQEKQTERQKSFHRVQEYRRTGVKPEGWRRGTDDKILEEERERDQRFEAKKREMNEAAEKREQEKLDRERQRKESSMKSEALIGAMDAWAEKAAERQEFKERIRVSHDGGEDTMIDALMDYLDELDDDNRRIQFCYDMIKICRNIAVELQHRQYKEDAGE
ncbi:MAG: DUF3102 domain-containing protein [Spirochaetota bacterium]|nr:DUF3102 domain-containing protein [Spirochaetota bacterium]